MQTQHSAAVARASFGQLPLELIDDILPRLCPYCAGDKPLLREPATHTQGMYDGRARINLAALEMPLRGLARQAPVHFQNLVRIGIRTTGGRKGRKPWDAYENIARLFSD